VPNKIYCPAPFKSIRVDATNQGVSIRPCCAYQSQTNEHNSLDHYLAGQELKDLKQHFMSDRDYLPLGCQRCQQQEDLNQTSWRTHFNNKFSDPDDHVITQIEAFPGNVCNLKCFMCNPHTSTSLASEYKKLGWILDYKEIDNAESILSIIKNLDSLAQVSFIGGEFFLTKDNLKILDLAIAKKLSVSLTTNATILLPDHLERLLKIKDLEIQISIDGIGPSYEFMRYPAQWTGFDKNVKTLKSLLPQAKIISNFVVQILNLQYLIPTADYLNRAIIPAHFTNLVDPNWLTWPVLTKTEIVSLISCLDQQILTYKITTKQKQEIKQYIELLESTKTNLVLRETFISNIARIMKVRNIDHSVVRKHFGILSDLADLVCQ
jgi:sulfatase maturation enzyme AslB (radical SAM superfamily)